MLCLTHILKKKKKVSLHNSNIWMRTRHYSIVFLWASSLIFVHIPTSTASTTHRIITCQEKTQMSNQETCLYRIYNSTECARYVITLNGFHHLTSLKLPANEADSWTLLKIVVKHWRSFYDFLVVIYTHRSRWLMLTHFQRTTTESTTHTNLTQTEKVETIYTIAD